MTNDAGLPRCSSPTPPSYLLDPGRSLTIVRSWGATDGGELVRIAQDLAADPAWDASYCHLWDMREVTYFVLTLEQVKAFVAGVQPKWQAAPRIAIVARRELDLSTAKIIKSYMPELSIRIFTDYNEALLWLTEPAA